MHLRSPFCERARLWASLRSDGELSELESALLDAHLPRCGSCRAFAGGVEEVARGLRRVRLVQPAPLVVATPRARSAAHGVQAAASVVAVAAAGESPDALRILRRADLIQQGRGIVHWRLRRQLAEPV